MPKVMQSAEDERQIIALINRYATGLDTADWALLRSCWTDEVDVDYGTGQTWSSADALNEFMEHFHTGLTTMHMNTNFVISEAGEGRATGRTYFRALLLRSDGALFLRAAGWYDDCFVKMGSEWKITKRHVRMIAMQQGGT
ncbi:MAG TPA: nuclear transport factor 2 family protein [Acetobacteraceae bacterium]|nr:nuclear transport factor 2 family protein [Acetobacteraceae bacterium]